MLKSFKIQKIQKNQKFQMFQKFTNFLTTCATFVRSLLMTSGPILYDDLQYEQNAFTHTNKIFFNQNVF